MFRQPRGSGPSAAVTRPTLTWLYLVAVAHVSTIARPVLVPIEATSPERRRALNVTSKPSQWLSRSGPKSVSTVWYVFAAVGPAAAVTMYDVIGYPPPPGSR